LDIRPLLHQIHGAGHPVGLPVVTGKGQPLLFRRWSPGTALVQGSFKVLTPPDGTPEIEPDVLLVPLLAFDRDGFRWAMAAASTIAPWKSAGTRRILAIRCWRSASASRRRKPRTCRAGRSTSGWDWIVTEAWARKCTRVLELRK
jgi:5-formyltetrahydrofolate cyclo-ligase